MYSSTTPIFSADRRVISLTRAIFILLAALTASACNEPGNGASAMATPDPLTIDTYQGQLRGYWANESRQIRGFKGIPCAATDRRSALAAAPGSTKLAGRPTGHRAGPCLLATNQGRAICVVQGRFQTQRGLPLSEYLERCQRG